MSASPRTTEAPTRHEQPILGDSTGDRFRVILYNDDVHAFDDVVSQVQRATGVSTEEAFAITLQAHEAGRAVCYVGSSDACDKVAGVLREIALHVEVDHSG
jgi:ATP-dependent Clp protease adapter protein ClpS